jgi:uncharacterized protein YeeX (DUF496 family)
VAKHIHRFPKNSDSEKHADPVPIGKHPKEQANSNQYFRLANEVIKEKIDTLKRFQEGMKRFSEGGSLKNRIKSLQDLDKINPKYVTDEDVKDLIAHLEDEYEKSQDRLLCQEIILEKTRNEISAKRKEIDEMKEKLNVMLQKRQKIREDMVDPIEALREELKRVGVDDKDQIYQLINEVAEALNMKNLKGQIKND